MERGVGVIEYILEIGVGIFTFIEVFLKGYQIKAMQHNRVVMIGFLSLFISITFMISVYFIIEGSWLTRASLLVGAPLGAMASNIVYNRRKSEERN